MLTRPLLLLSFLALSTHAAAQSRTVAAPDLGLGGAPVAGVCLLDQNRLVTESKVGKATIERLAVIGREAQAELDALQGPIDADIKAFESRRAATPAPSATTIASESKTIAERISGFQTLSQISGQDLATTRLLALQRVGEATRSVIPGIYKARGCGLLLDASSVLAGNAALDITPAVIQALDAKGLPTDFKRERQPLAVLSPLPTQP